MNLFLKIPYFIGDIKLSRSGRVLFQGRHHNLFSFDTNNVQAKQKVDIQSFELGQRIEVFVQVIKKKKPYHLEITNRQGFKFK